MDSDGGTDREATPTTNGCKYKIHIQNRNTRYKIEIQNTNTKLTNGFRWKARSRGTPQTKLMDGAAVGGRGCRGRVAKSFFKDILSSFYKNPCTVVHCAA